MTMRDMFWWAWYSVKRIMRKEQVPEEVKRVAKKWAEEDEACEGTRTPVEIRIWRACDAHAISTLPKGPEHIAFGPHDFWDALDEEGAVGIVAEQAGKVVGVLVMREMEIVRFAVAGHCRKEGIGTRLLDFLTVLISPLPQLPITAEVDQENDAAMAAFKKAQFVATMIQRNQPEPGRSLYTFEYPPHIGWKRGRIRIVDGDEIRTITAPQMQRQ